MDCVRLQALFISWGRASNFDIDQSWCENYLILRPRVHLQTFHTDHSAHPSLTAMSDPFSINGGSIVALVGKDCVGIACDLRLGQQAMTVSTDFPKIFPMGEKVFLGLSGLATDVQTLYLSALPVWICDWLFRNELFRFKTNMYRLREERPIEPKTLAHLVSSTLYEKRHYQFCTFKIF